ncbi:MAG: ATP synthase F1 subunit epsilon [Patescibacteria group bacterium]|nr:ATP synthase F1 subunit epsilon [Patescibacteria group bacterium]MDD5490442.1 ATP synthase F1 subunit epsilon [Patescibacteria group bacterium]
MAKKIFLEITTLEKTLYSGEVDQVSIPTKMGEITILPGHIALVSALSSGELKALAGNDVVSFAVVGGFAEITRERVIIMADTADLPEDLEEEKITAARGKVEELIKKYPKESQEYSVLSERLENELAKLKLIEQLKGKKRKKV